LPASKNFCGAKKLGHARGGKNSGRALEIKTGFSKSVRRQAPDPGLLQGLPDQDRPMSLCEGYGHDADREPVKDFRFD
jgi:hypothetical protein